MGQKLLLQSYATHGTYHQVRISVRS